MKIILCVPFPCKGHVPLLVFLCDENQALTSARFLENKFWKKPVMTWTTDLHLEKKIFLSGKQKIRSLSWSKTLHFGKRSLPGLRYSLSKSWAKIVQYVAILGLNLCLSQREMVITTKKNLRFLSCLPYFGPIPWFMWLSLGLFALVGKNIVHFSTILR